MLQVQRGKVKFFRTDKGWGIITPSNGTEDVFFHVDYYSGVSEKWAGELELTFDQDSELAEEWQAPHTGEEVIYEPYKGQKGLMALHWLRPQILRQAQKAIAIRPAPNNAFTRVMRSGTRAERYRPTVIWKGTAEQFRTKCDGGFPEMFDCRYFVEELKINSKWDRDNHPSNWHPKYKTPCGDKLLGMRIRLHKPKTWNGKLEGKLIGITGHWDENLDGMFKNPVYGAKIDGNPGMIESLRRSEFDFVTA